MLNNNLCESIGYLKQLKSLKVVDYSFTLTKIITVMLKVVTCNVK